MLVADWLLGFTLGMLRFTACMAVFRAGQRFLSWTAALALAMACTAAYLSALPVGALNGIAAHSPGLLLLAGLRELYLGVLAAVPSVLALECLAAAGRFTDVSRGALFAEQVQPELGGRVSMLEQLGRLAALVLLFTLGGYRLILTPLFECHLAAGLSLGSGALNPLPPGSADAAQALLRLSQEGLTTGLLLAAPVMLLALVIDLGAMLLTRSLSRINVLFELMPLKMLLGILVFALSVSQLPDTAQLLLSAAAQLTGTLLEQAVF